MAWLLRFLVSWLKVLGIEISNEVFEKIILNFPGSLYLVQQFLNFDGDNFNKFAVCPKCTKLYKYDFCLSTVNNRQVAKTCSNTYFSRGRKMTCNATIVTTVTLQNGKSRFYPIKYYCTNSIIEELEKICPTAELRLELQVMEEKRGGGANTCRCMYVCMYPPHFLAS